MQKKGKNKFSLVKVICICLILVLLSGVGVMAMNSTMNTIKIELSNGYEMTVFTSKSKVKDILEDNNIMLKENEKVSPNLEDEILEDGTIKISNKTEQEIEIARVSESGVEMTLETLLDAYSAITEKIEVIEEPIPYETITKDISNGDSNTKNRVLQAGEEGIKRVTYKIKYQNNIEIEKNKISEEIIKEPVNKIVQVRSNSISSRSEVSSRTGATDINVSNVYKVTAYCPCSRCCGSYANGITAMGTTAKAGRTIAAPSNFPFGTRVLMNGHEYVVEDRGGAIKGNRIDLYVNTHAEALAWGVKYLTIEVLN